MTRILIKEFNSFLDSLIAYIVITVFLTSTGLLMWVFPETSVLNYGYADLEVLFTVGPYVFMFLIPALTMKMFAEERNAGTLEFLLTKPLNDYQIITGKYLAGLLLVGFSMIPTLIYYYSVSSLGNPPGNLDTAGTAGSYLGLFLLGAVFTSIGLFSSSISGNQIIAFVIAVFMCFIFYSGFDSLASINVWSEYSTSIQELGILYHYDALSRGLIDSRNLVYFVSIIFLMLLFTKVSIGSRRW